MIKAILKRFLSLVLCVLMVCALLPVTAYAEQLTGLDDQTVGIDVDNKDNWKVAAGSSIEGTINGDGCNASSTNLIITNNKANTAKLMFGYEVTLNSGTIVIDGNSVSEGGLFEKTLDPAGQVVIELTSNKNDTNKTTIKITNIKLIEESTVKVTFMPAENGSYTVNGVQVTTALSYTQSSLKTYALEATPDEGYTFVGWYDKTNDTYLQDKSNADVMIPYDCEVTAKFAQAGSIFGVGSERFDDLNTAINYAVGNGLAQVTLLKDHTITGNYTIPQGVTLLIPFDDAGTCYKDAPESVGDTHTQPTVFRMLTMASGASITIKGAISVSAKHSANGNATGAWGGGAPSGPYGYIKMEDASKIIIASGGTLYAWGYISGQGSVIAESGSTVYENMQIRDFRGGTATIGLRNKAKNKAFFFNQYYIQNIEAELILEHGANEFVCTSLYAGDQSNSTTIQFIGDGGMFSVTPGSTLSKRYLSERDRIEVVVNGDATINNLSLTLSLGSMSVSLDSKDYVLPITNSMIISILSGTTKLTQDIAMLPGVEINIAKGAILQVNENCNLYVYDRDEWVGKQFARGDIQPVSYSPTREYTRSDKDVVDCKIDVNGTLLVNGYIYTTTGGANICSSEGSGKTVLIVGAGAATETYQVVGTASDVTAVSITAAKLHNADGSYTETAGAEAGDTYDYVNGKWCSHKGAVEEVAEQPATCTEDGHTAGTKCSNCGKIISGCEKIPAKGHTEEIRNAKEATLTEDGYTGDTYCSVCEELLKEGTVIPKTGATITWIVDGVKTTEVYEKGTMPSFKGETTKADDRHYSYTFAGWDCELVSVTEDATYTAQFNKTGKNGLCIEEDGTYWLVDGEHAEFPGLIRINAGTEEQPHYHYYYFGEDGKAVKDGDYKVDKNNGLPLPCYKYHFDENGIIEHDDDTGKNGICQGEESKLFYYIDGVKVGEGLIQVDGYYYYARTSSGEIVRNCDYWVTKTNEWPIQEGKYHFDADGKMVINGFVKIDGATYYYQDGTLAKGLTKIGDDYYLFNDRSGKMYRDGNYWVKDQAEYGIIGGLYPFDKDGKMQPRNGWYHDEKGHADYYYCDNELVKGFAKIEDSYYFFNKASGKLYKNATLWVADNTYGISAGMYSFGADGKMIVPDLENGVKAIVSENGKLYFTIDGARMFRGLYELNGEYYYANSNGELVVNSSAYINAEMLSGEGWYGFDAEGKLVKTGFVDGGGYTYYYENGIRAKGFTKIGDAYYLFNAASGKLYKDATLWVGANNYGITGGLYYFDANGRMTSKAA